MDAGHECDDLLHPSLSRSRSFAAARQYRASVFADAWQSSRDDPVP